MKAVVLHEHGGPEVLRAETLDAEAPGPGQVQVDIHACAVNRLDLWVRGGLPNLKIPYPHVLGSDIAGVVSRVGPGVDAARVGEEVVLQPGVSCGQCESCLSGWDNLCARYRILGENTRGGYAEAITVPEVNLLPKPPNLSMVEAAAFPLTFLTAWQMLMTRAQVQRGETVLLHAAGSGVGVAGLQIAKLHGARVVALASTEPKRAQALELGADVAIDSSDPAWPRAVRAVEGVGRRGVDVVFEHVGQSTWGDSLKLCRTGGRIVTCGASSGHEAQTDLRHVFFRQLQILGSTMGRKSDLMRMLPWFRSGALRPIVDREFPLEAAAEAHRYLDRREQFGKVVLVVRP